MGEILHEMEHASHAGHNDHGSGGIGKYIGITMAVLGVMVVLCSAMVGGARTELIATMVEQTNTALTYSAAATKYRMLQAQLQQLHALMPSDPKEFQALEAQAAKLEQDAAKSASGEAIKAIRVEAKMILGSVIPTREDVLRFAALVRKYDTEKDAAKEWAESYEPAIKIHSGAAEHFEWGQLGAEIGIVIASIALLMQNRKAWMLSLLLGITSFTIIIGTFLGERSKLHEAEELIHKAKAHYSSLTSEDKDREEDEKLLADIERPLPGETPAPHAPTAHEAPHEGHPAPAH
jgi:hypothetical protein